MYAAELKSTYSSKCQNLPILDSGQINTNRKGHKEKNFMSEVSTCILGIETMPVSTTVGRLGKPSQCLGLIAPY